MYVDRRISAWETPGGCGWKYGGLEAGVDAKTGRWSWYGLRDDGPVLGNDARCG